MSSSNCCFLTCIQISQEAGQVVWYSHLFQNFPHLPCFVWKGFPTFRSHLRMRPVSRRHSRRGLVGGSTFRRTPISRSPLDKNPMPGHLSELHPVNEVHTTGQFFRASFAKNPRFQIQLDKRPLSPGTCREASGVPCLNPRRGLTLLSPVCRDPAIGV